MKSITIIGAGVIGLWQALVLARRGHRVCVIERSEKPFIKAASWIAGAMLAPHCEAESAEPIVRDMGLASIPLWRDAFPGTVMEGSLVLANPRDLRELTRFARATTGFEELNGERIGELEPALADRFSRGLYYPGEAHMQPFHAMAAIMQRAKAAGATFKFGQQYRPDDVHSPAASSDLIIDCRGMAARDQLKDLRGVRGEMVVVRTSEINLSRPVRLLHPRFPLYVVPWPNHQFMIGATSIESDDKSPVTVRSALELLGTAYALHPAFGEAEIIEFAADVRPAFPDNCPKIIVQDGVVHVNGSFRHGYLMAPALALAVADYIKTGEMHPEVFVENHIKR